MRVNRDPSTVGLDTHGLQTDVGYPWTSAGCHQHAVAAYRPAVVEGQNVIGPVASSAGDVRSEDELDAVPAQDLAERATQLFGFARQHPLGAGDQDHLAAETTDRLGHLDADRPAADDHQATRDCLHAGHLAVGPNAFKVSQSRDRRDEGIRAAGQDDVLGGVTYTVHLDSASPREPASAAQQSDTLAGQPAFLPGVGIAGDHEVAPGERRLDVDL